MLGSLSAEISIYADIGMWGITAAQFKTDLEALGAINEITIRINSYGGEVFDGNAIFNLLVEHPASKTVIVDGVAASIASVIAMAADPGKIKMPENAFLMIHDPTIGIVGGASDLRKKADLLDDIKNNAIKAYQRHAKDLTDEELWDLMKDETWINAADAKTYGFTGDVIASIDADEPVTNTGRVAPVNVKKILCQYKQPAGPSPENKGVHMFKCPHCGKEHSAEVKFCGDCGKPMNKTTADEARNREIAELAAEQERARILDITTRCEKFGLSSEFKNELITKKVPVEKAVGMILDKIAEQAKPVTPDTKIIKDEGEKFRMHTQNSLQVALGTIKDKAIIEDVRKNPGPRDLHSLTRACLRKEGQLTASQIDNLSAENIAQHAIRMAGMGSSDLPAVLADTMNKEFLGGFEGAPTTFQEVVAETDNPNFMTKSMTKISSFSDMDDLPEGMPFKQGKFSDKKEQITLATKGKMLTLTRQLIANNDTAAISTFPRAMSTSMRLKMNRDFYDLLTSNALVGPTCVEDSVAFFNDTAHGNLEASSGVPSVSTLGAADKKMLEQTLLKSTPDAPTEYLNLTGSILLTGTANRMTCLQLFGSANDPAATDGKIVTNPYNGMIRPVFDAYLQSKLTTAGKTYAWYLFAGPSIFRNWVVAYLSGNRTPTLRSEPSQVGQALGISYDIFFDYAFGFEDYRGCIQSDGD